MPRRHCPSCTCADVPQRTDWIARFCTRWQERYQGVPPGGQIGRQIKPLLAAHPEEEVEEAWAAYLAATDAPYASPARFAQTYGEWAGTAGPSLNNATRTTANGLQGFLAASQGVGKGQKAVASIRQMPMLPEGDPDVDE